MAKPICITDYNVSPETGFLLENVLEYLPKYFEAWNHLAKAMPDLVAKHEMRKSVSQLPLLDTDKLTGHRQKRLAHLQLVIITSGYVWEEGDEGVVKHLPKCLAVPLWKISQELGLKPIVCHPDVCLANYKFTEDKKDLSCLYLIPGGEQAEWFFRVTCYVEMAFARGLQTMQNILNGISEDDRAKVKASLSDLSVVVANMQFELKKMHDKLSADVFYNVMRPYLGGWGGENSPLPNGLIYDGISENPVKCNGGSAAQSTTLQFLDILLGVRHSTDKQSFLNEMRNYMPPSHKQLLVDLENMPRTLAQMVSSSSDEDLLKAYNSALESVKKLRSYHIQVVTKYIIVPASKNKNDFESLSKKGTGGTDLLPFLKDIRNDTDQTKL